MASTTTVSGSAARWGPRWGSRPADWAASEEQQLPTYEEAIRRVGLGAGRRVLEVGCGSGVFLRAAADRGASVFGLDASPALLELARARVPEADLRVGDLAVPPVRGRLVRRRRRVQRLLLRRRHGRRAPRGRTRREAREARGDPGLGCPRALRPRRDQADRPAAVPRVRPECSAASRPRRARSARGARRRPPG